MRISAVWFRPELDDLGVWEDWTLAPEEMLSLQNAQADAATEAIAELRGLFGQASAVFGAEALADRLGQRPIDATAAGTLARTIATLDYFQARSGPPRPSAGGLTNPRNRRRWARLRPHLLARVSSFLAEDGGRSILWHSILGRVPETWISVPLLQRSMAAGLVQSETYETVDVTLDLATDPPGGLQWLADGTRQAVAAIEAGLRRGRPSLVELVRADEPAPSATAVVIAYGIGKTAGGETRIRVHDPQNGGPTHLVLPSPASGAGRILLDPDDGDRSSILALRRLAVEPARPPLFGPRRYLFWLLPWRLFWWIRRWFVLTFRRG